ncbi:unnamed protein product [Ilex paraguariensis]|uniref:Uncharacterized protein n=1 Tax=Ilex paraguariensis TaxID=185542 RepID=A0ABC8SZD9_9AQUA
MGELFAISQSSILLPQAPSRGRHYSVGFHRASSTASSVRFLRTRSEPAVFFPTISAQALQQKRFSWGIRSADSEVPPTLTVESASDGNEIQPDSSGGGDEFGGVSGGGGRGRGNNWGNNNNEGEGGSDESEDTSKKKMAMSMSQKLTLGYAALVGGKSPYTVGRDKR